MDNKSKCTVGEIKKHLYNIVKKEFEGDIQDLKDRVYTLECIVQECLPAEMLSFDVNQKKEKML